MIVETNGAKYGMKSMTKQSCAIYDEGTHKSAQVKHKAHRALVTYQIFEFNYAN